MLIPPQLPRAPFLAFTGALCGGILLFYKAGVPAWTGLVLLALGCLIWLLLAGRRLRYAARELVWLPILLCFLGTGVLTAWLNAPAEELPDGYLAWGTVKERADRGHGTRLLVEVEGLTPRRLGEERRVHTKIQLYSDSVELRVGDKILFPAWCTPVEGEDDYSGYLFGKGVDFRGYCPAELIVAEGRSGGLAVWGEDWRSAVVERIQRSELKADTRGFVAALLLGERSGMDGENRKAFTAAGIAHVLAVSGLHVGIVLLLLTLLLRPLDMLGGRHMRYVLTLGGIWIFALLTGCGAPVLRAAMMASCVLVALMLQRPRVGLNSLCLAAFMILIWNPRALFDAGFLLSFSVTAGIMFLAMELAPSRERVHPRLRGVVLWMLVPCVAFLCSWMLTAKFFHSVQLLFLPVNLLIAPLLPFYFGVGGVYVILLMGGVDCGWCAWLLDSGYQGLLRCAEWIGTQPGASVSLYVNDWAVLFYMGSLAFFSCYLRTRKRRWLTASGAGVVIALGMILLLPVPVPPDSFSVGGSYKTCELRSTHRGEQEYHTLPRGGVSGCVLHGRRVVFLDGELAAGLSVSSVDCEILIIGSGYCGSLAEVRRVIKADSVVWHPSLSLGRRDELMSEAVRE